MGVSSNFLYQKTKVHHYYYHFYISFSQSGFFEALKDIKMFRGAAKRKLKKCSAVNTEFKKKNLLKSFTHFTLLKNNKRKVRDPLIP